MHPNDLVNVNIKDKKYSSKHKDYARRVDAIFLLWQYPQKFYASMARIIKSRKEYEIYIRIVKL